MMTLCSGIMVAGWADLKWSDSSQQRWVTEWVASYEYFGGWKLASFTLNLWHLLQFRDPLDMTETVESCFLSPHLHRPLPLSEKQVLQHWSLRRARDRDFLSLTTMITSLPLSLSSLEMFSDVSLKRTPALFLLSLLSSALLTLVLKSNSLGRAILDICLLCHCKYCVIIYLGWFSRLESHHLLLIVRQQTDCYKLQTIEKTHTTLHYQHLCRQWAGMIQAAPTWLLLCSSWLRVKV